MTLFKKLRFLSRLTKAFLSKWYILIFLGIFLGIVTYFFIPKIVKNLPLPLKVVKIGILGKYTIQEVPDEILKKLSRGLTKELDNGTVLPDVSSSWQISPDGQVYTFNFKDKVFWNDGSEFKPDDVNYNFKEAKILPIDFQTLKIKLDENFAPFLSVVSQPLFKKGLIGLGDYKVDKIERSGQILKSILLVPVKKNDTNPKILYRFYVNIDYLKTAFKLGEVDIIENLDSNNQFIEWKNISYSQAQNDLQHLVLFFNTKKDPFFDKNFRQAISYGIGKETGKKRSFGPLSHTSWAFNPGIKKYDIDLDKAKLLLSKIKLKPDAVFSINTFLNLESEANKIKKQLTALGIKSEVKLTPYSPEDFDMLLAIVQIPKDPDQYLLWHTTSQQSNISHFSNPRIDKLLEEGRKTQNHEERKKIYFDFQRFLVEESPAVFLSYPSYYRLERK